MRPSKSRSRSKSNRSRSIGNIVNRVFESSGPEGKVRGTPQQVIDKYNQLAHDAQLANDRVAAENFLQHAEHYLRLLGEAQREIDNRREHTQPAEMPKEDKAFPEEMLSGEDCLQPSKTTEDIAVNPLDSKVNIEEIAPVRTPEITEEKPTLAVKEKTLSKASPKARNKTVTQKTTPQKMQLSTLKNPFIADVVDYADDISSGLIETPENRSLPQVEKPRRAKTTSSAKKDDAVSTKDMTSEQPSNTKQFVFTTPAKEE